MSEKHLPTPDASDSAPGLLPLSTQPRRAPEPTPEPAASMYERLGPGVLEDLVAAFYRRVADDEVLRPLYPEEDLGPAEERLRLFLIQYWGGPTTYSQTRGHPRLRMRHAPFPVGGPQIEAWLHAMHGALEEVAPPAAEREELWAYFVRAAHFMRNRDDV